MSSDRKRNYDWLNLFVPLVIIGIFAAIYWGIRFANASSNRNEAVRAQTAQPSPTPRPTSTASPKQQTVVTTQPKTAAVNWAKIRLLDREWGCQPAYATADRASQVACFPNGMAIVSTSQQQNGFTACKCWFPGLPGVDPPATEQYNVCKGSQDGLFWVDSEALQEQQNANSTF